MADINAKDKYGMTPLMYAVKNAVDRRSEKAVTRLLDLDANLEDTSKYGRTALMFAVDEYSTTTKRTVQILLDAGADINARDYLQNTPLLCCVGPPFEAKLRYAKMKILLDAGADINAQDHSGCTVLMRIAVNVKKYGRENAVRLLLAYGADANITDCNGNEVLAHIMRFGSRDTGSMSAAKILLDVGADITMKNKNSHTALRATIATLYYGKEIYATVIINMLVENIFY